MITDAVISYEDMQKMVAAGAKCGKCQGVLTLAWGGAHGYNGHILKCSDITHDTLTRHDKKYEEQINIIRRERKLDSKALMIMEPKAMMERVNMAKFPQDLTVKEKELLAEVAITYGFDPLMNEVTIYQGRPYVSTDGRYRKAQETDKLDGVESRPATQEERKDWKIPDGDYFFRAEVYVKEASRPFVGWGRVFERETKPGSNRQGDTTSIHRPVQSNPQRMAEKRAEAQALRKSFHIPLPSVEDIGGELEIDSVTVTVEKEQPKELKAATPADKRGEFEKDGRDLTKEAVTKATTEQTAPEPEPATTVAEPAPEPAADEATTVETPPPATGPIDLDWLQEQLGILQGKKLEGWTNTNIVSYLKSITGHDAKGVSEAVSYLNKEQAELFVQRIKETIEMA